MNTKQHLSETLRNYKRGWLTHAEAVAELLAADPVRFQRQEHQAASFLALN